MDHLLTRFALALGIVMIGAILLASAAVSLCVALYLYLAPGMGPPAAAALTGLAALIATMLSFITGRLMLVPSHHRRHRAARLAAGPEDPHLVQALSALFGEELGRTFSERPKGAAVTALAAGFAIGVSPGLRRLLLDLLGSGR